MTLIILINAAQDISVNQFDHDNQCSIISSSISLIAFNLKKGYIYTLWHSVALCVLCVEKNTYIDFNHVIYFHPTPS
jgi:hypothetical protein